MVCNRCIFAVKGILQQLDIDFEEVNLGQAILKEELDSEKLTQLSKSLQDIGFEIIDDKRTRLIEKIKSVIIELIYKSEHPLNINLSDFLADKVNYDYKYLSSIFSEVEGKTIEKYYISQKIERVKELLVYDELNLSEIAFKLGYSSVAHLSSQFKKITGLTPSHFKQIGAQRRKPIDEV